MCMISRVRFRVIGIRCWVIEAGSVNVLLGSLDMLLGSLDGFLGSVDMLSG